MAAPLEHHLTVPLRRIAAAVERMRLSEQPHPNAIAVVAAEKAAQHVAEVLRQLERDDPKAVPLLMALGAIVDAAEAAAAPRSWTPIANE